MLSLHEFQSLGFDKKCDYIAFHGTYLASRPAEAKKIYLYYLHNFFIEVWITDRSNKVVCISAFTDTTNLEPYLSTIQINNLFGSEYRF
jgi:hypothetical protein